MTDGTTVLNAARDAYRRTAFYRDLYGTEPTTVEEVPFISFVEYHHARGTADCIDHTHQLISYIPPYHRNVRRFPFTIVESEDDLEARQERVVKALEDIGLPSGCGKRVLIVTDDAHGPFACDMEAGLGWEYLPASIWYWNGHGEDLQQQLDAHKPELIVWCLPESPPPLIPQARERLLLIHHLDRPVPAVGLKTWLFTDEANLIASRPDDREVFDIDRTQYAVEVDPRSGLPHITTIEPRTMPLVRYAIEHPIPGWEA
ncbi:MAG: hypothetical protein HN742_02530 [Lentisphaerae bacterium]|jgi:hypothetical protein|nr:hypothetical protein [Lentisphaerota bacterium]MBT4819668.1 hypothetical protein [Lentisphaerota bacterium]MBT5608048.1 hypothetical protein [Lentisphaerota bacterium]MBT7056484.1 hypothetical protein [Lentisphaerota bacterium]MBT7840715.1 hypothetical protein [Lentisphaerota bacterium]